MRIRTALALAFSAAMLNLMAVLAPANAADPGNTLVIELKSGPVRIELLPKLAPKHVARVKQLARDGYYNGVKWHRVIGGFMAQTGDHTGTGTGGSKYGNLPLEASNYVYRRGTVGAARTQDPNTANSQFFICFDDNGCRGLTGQYTVWGQVISGMENVEKLKTGAPGSGAVSNPDVMQKVYVLSDKK